MTYDCMTADELTLWQEGAELVARQTGYLTKKPCADCPLAFRMAEYNAGRCCLPKPEPWDVILRRRAYKAEWNRLARARAKAHNDGAGTSSPSIIPDAVPLLVPGGTASSR